MSRPSVSATSALATLPATSEFALLPRRCVSVTSWAAVAISRAGAPDCSFSAVISSVSCCRRGLASLIFLMTSPKASSAFSLATMTEAADWLPFQRSISLASGGCRSEEDGARPFSASPLASASRLAAIASRLSRNSTKASRLPSTAFGAAFASRCVCISVSPMISVCSAPFPAMRLSKNSTATSTKKLKPSRISSTCTWVFTGLSPISGSLKASSRSTTAMVLPSLLPPRSIITVFGAGRASAAAASRPLRPLRRVKTEPISSAIRSSACTANPGSAPGRAHCPARNDACAARAALPKAGPATH